MGAYTPSEAVAALRDKAAGQDIFLAVVIGPDAELRERLAINRFDRCPTIDCGPTLVSGGTITAVCSSMTGELAQTLTGIASDFGDELYGKGLLKTDVPIQATFAMATVEAFQNKQLHIGKTHFENGYEIHCLPGYVSAVEMFLKRLGKQPIRQNELPSNPTAETQTCEKATRRNGDKSEKWLRLLVESYRSELLEEARNRGITLADSKKRGVTFTDGDVDYYLATLVFCKSAKELSGMVADLPPTNGEKPPQRLTIKAARNILYREWEPYREQRNKKLIVGVNSIEEALDSGLSERSNRSSYVPAKTPAERLEDLETARLDKEADAILKRTPKV